MIWQGIMLRGILIIANYLLFRYVLGYELREKTSLFIAAILSAIVTVLLAIFVDQAWAAVTAVACVFAVQLLTFRQLKIWVVFLYEEFFTSVQNFLSGLLLVSGALGGADMTNWQLRTLICNIIVLAAYVCLAFILREKRGSIHEVMVKIPLRTYLIFIAVLCIPTISYFHAAKTDAVETEGIFTAIDGMTGIIFTVIIAVGVWLYVQRRALAMQTELKDRCIEKQTEQYHFLYEKQAKLRRFRHDSRAHLKAILALAEEAEDEKIAAYVKQLIGEEKEMRQLTTGNIIGDAIVNHYYTRGLSENVGVELMGQFARGLAVSETDLCVILSNVVSNAYEAAVKCEKDRVIHISLTNYKDKQFLKVENPSPVMPVIEAGKLQVPETTKANKENHGLGIRNTLDAVARAGGSAEWYRAEKPGQIYVIFEAILPVCRTK